MELDLDALIGFDNRKKFYTITLISGLLSCMSFEITYLTFNAAPRVGMLVKVISQNHRRGGVL